MLFFLGMTVLVADDLENALRLLKMKLVTLAEVLQGEEKIEIKEKIIEIEEKKPAVDEKLIKEAIEKYKNLATLGEIMKMKEFQDSKEMETASKGWKKITMPAKRKVIVHDDYFKEAKNRFLDKLSGVQEIKKIKSASKIIKIPIEQEKIINGIRDFLLAQVNEDAKKIGFNTLLTKVIAEQDVIKAFGSDSKKFKPKLEETKEIKPVVSEKAAPISKEEQTIEEQTIRNWVAKAFIQGSSSTQKEDLVKLAFYFDEYASNTIVPKLALHRQEFRIRTSSFSFSQQYTDLVKKLIQEKHGKDQEALKNAGFFSGKIIQYDIDEIFNFIKESAEKVVRNKVALAQKDLDGETLNAIIAYLKVDIEKQIGNESVVAMYNYGLMPNVNALLKILRRSLLDIKQDDIKDTLDENIQKFLKKAQKEEKKKVESEKNRQNELSKKTEKERKDLENTERKKQKEDMDKQLREDKIKALGEQYTDEKDTKERENLEILIKNGAVHNIVFDKKPENEKALENAITNQKTHGDFTVFFPFDPTAPEEVKSLLRDSLNIDTFENLAHVLKIFEDNSPENVKNVNDKNEQKRLGGGFYIEVDSYDIVKQILTKHLNTAFDFLEKGNKEAAEDLKKAYLDVFEKEFKFYAEMASKFFTRCDICKEKPVEFTNIIYAQSLVDKLADYSDLIGTTNKGVFVNEHVKKIVNSILFSMAYMDFRDLEASAFKDKENNDNNLWLATENALKAYQFQKKDILDIYTNGRWYAGMFIVNALNKAIGENKLYVKETFKNDLKTVEK